MSGAWGDSKTQFFFEITPDRVLESVEAGGLQTTGRCIQLNSFENRVYDVELEIEEEKDSKSSPTNSASRRIVKFYRPGRWSREQILEEHQFLNDLRAAEIPAIAPLPFPNGETIKLSSKGEIVFALFPKVGGRAPDELTDDQLMRIGMLLARIHNVGAQRTAPHRVTLTPTSYGFENLAFLLANNWIPLEYRTKYEAVVKKICEKTELLFKALPSKAIHRVHGDCHFGNLLWNQEGPFFLDFDDMVNAPAVQDVWLLTPGRDEEARRQREVLLEGYEQMRTFDRATLRLIEPLRALRFVHYTAWIARRWEDPAFPAAFPEFGSHSYWADETKDLEDQWELIRDLT